MQQDVLKGKAIPAFIGAGLSLFFIKSGVLFLFFLVPFGVLAYRYDKTITWMSLFLAILGNAVVILTEAALKAVPLSSSVWDFLYFVIMATIFVWILHPPRGFLPNLPGVARLVIGSSVGAMLISFLLFRMMASPGFLEFLDSWIAMFANVNRTDTVRFAILEALTPEGFLEIMKNVVLRGGSLVTCVFIFFICRQFGMILANLSILNKAGGNAERKLNSMSSFHVVPELIWVFSLALALVVLTTVLKLKIPEIILWNVLILCVMLYLAQGLGILQFFLARPSTPGFLKFFLIVLLVVLMFSPVVNAIIFGGIFLLGIIENWVPFRAPKQNGPPSTPEAGGGNA